jgi:hypothetical protein
MGRAIFISYRRDDTEGEAGRLFDDLVRSFGEDSVFMDVSGINPGMDFRKAIDDNVASCGVLLAMIGPAWCSMKNSAGGRRLDDPNDFVRLEIASALARNIAVIPVLVHDSKMPRPEELPDNLKDLAYRNSVEITHARWNSDVQLLTQALTRYVAPTAPSDTAPVHATVSVQLPPPTPPATRHRSSRPSSVPLILGIVTAAVLALGMVAFFMFRGPNPAPQPGPPTPANVVTPHAPAPAPTSPIVGTWTNPTPVQQNGLVRMEISAKSEQALSIHAWGQCGQAQCDWGTQDAGFDGQQAQASWQFGTNGPGSTAKRTAAVTIKPNHGQLSVAVANTYADHPSTQHEFTFVKAQ